MLLDEEPVSGLAAVVADFLSDARGNSLCEALACLGSIAFIDPHLQHSNRNFIVLLERSRYPAAFAKAISRGCRKGLRQSFVR